MQEESEIKIKKPKRKPTRQKSTSSSSEAEPEKAVKKQKQKTHSFQKATYSASNSASSLIKDTATRTIDVDGTSIPESSKINDGFYHGQQSYTHTTSKNIKATQSSAGSLKGGVLYAPTNVRLTTRFDYNADVCKDYKETGFCGFGDSCKFIHDRGDYKTGWEIDLEYEKQQRQEKLKLLTDSFINENEKEEVDDLNCGVCGELFCDPIKTRCNHSFCEKCALKELNDVCKCGEKTSGIFLYDKELSGKVKIEKQRLAQLAESEDAN